VTKVKDPSHFGVVVFDKNNNIDKLIEKPKEIISNWALIGVFVFNERVFDSIKKLKPSRRGELEITDAIQLLINEGAKVETQFVKGWWKDTGKSEDLLEVNKLILQDIKTSIEGRIEDDVTITGKVRIDTGTIVHRNTVLQGPIVIGKECEIGSNSYIGPNTSIGNGVTISKSKIENSIVMEGAKINCNKRIENSIIGKNARVLKIRNNNVKALKLILGDMTSVSL
jgi:glucose-1-phosphate thymidylyltransferase